MANYRGFTHHTHAGNNLDNMPPFFKPRERHPQTPDSDFEGFDGEHRPPNAGGTRSAADKEVALLEHRLSGQIKGATMVSCVVPCVVGAPCGNLWGFRVGLPDWEGNDIVQ